jgi:ABC-2 type transport system ATP-binding protein
VAHSPEAPAPETVVEPPTSETPAEPVAEESLTAQPVTEQPASSESTAGDTAPESTEAVEQYPDPSATQAALAAASAWAKRVASASRTRIDELRESLAESLAEARELRASKANQAAAIAELAKTSEDPDIETSLDVPVQASVEASSNTPRLGVVLSVTGLSKRFDDTIAVAAINLEVRAGEMYGIVGPNGAGKTTTLSMITGLLRPDSGTVVVNGIDVWADPVSAKRQMGVLPDRLRLFDRLTGAQLLYYSGILRGLDAAVVRTRSADLARAFGLEDSMGRLVTDFSAGMTKKIALAAAMIHSPRMLILDEPFESVDPVSAATVTEILKKYAAAGGTVVLSSHSMDMVQRICDHVAVVVSGKVLADGTIDEVRGGTSLEDRFIELTGGVEVSEGLQWLHSFSS